MDNIEKLLESTWELDVASGPGAGTVGLHKLRSFLTFITVAPSLVMVCLPLASTINRSPPYGPSVDLIVACTAKQALMLETI